MYMITKIKTPLGTDYMVRRKRTSVYVSKPRPEDSDDPGKLINVDRCNNLYLTHPLMRRVFSV